MPTLDEIADRQQRQTLVSRFTAEVARFIRYGSVGAVITIVLYMVYLVLLFVGISPVTAAAVCYVPGVGFSYVFNRRWTFDSSGSHQRDLPKFLLAYGLGFISTLVTVAIMLRWLSAELAQIVNIAVTPVIIYTGLRLFRFGEQDRSTGD